MPGTWAAAGDCLARSRGPANSCSGLPRARCAAPMSMCSTASCRLRHTLIPGHEIVGIVEATIQVPRGSRPVRALACRGSDGPVASARSAWPGLRTSVRRRRSRVIRARAATRITRSRTSVSAFPAQRLRRCARGATAVRRPDRVSGLSPGDRASVRRRRGPPRALGVRRGGPPAGAGGSGRGAAGPRVSRTGDGPAQEHARRLGAVWPELRRKATGPARRGNPLRSGGCAGAVGASVVHPGGVVIFAGIHVSDIRRSHTRCSGRSASCVPGQPDARRRRRLSRRGRPAAGSSRCHLVSPSRTPTPLWTTCGTGACREPPCSFHDVAGPTIHSPAARRVPCRSRWRWAPRRWWSCCSSFAAADSLPWWARVALGVCWLAAVVIGAWAAERWPALDYAHTGYRLDGDGLRVPPRGAVGDRHARAEVAGSAPDVSQGPLERRYGLGTLVVYTAGTDHARVALPGWRTRSREPCATSFAPSGSMTPSEQRLHPALQPLRYGPLRAALCRARRCWRSSPAAVAAGRCGGTATGVPDIETWMSILVLPSVALSIAATCRSACSPEPDHW